MSRNPHLDANINTPENVAARNAAAQVRTTDYTLAGPNNPALLQPHSVRDNILSRPIDAATQEQILSRNGEGNDLYQSLTNAQTVRDLDENQQAFHSNLYNNLSRNILRFEQSDTPEDPLRHAELVINPRNEQIATSRANADAAQALTSNVSAPVALSLNRTADLARANQAQQVDAIASADEATKRDLFNIEAVAKGQAADTRSFSSSLSNTINNAEIDRANTASQRKIADYQARAEMWGTVAGAFAAGKFFNNKPGDEE